MINKLFVCEKSEFYEKFKEGAGKTINNNG